MIEHITPEAIANEIMMDRRFDGVYVLLEGVSDNRFFKKFLDQGVARHRVTHGFEKALAVIQLLRKRQHTGHFFAILDADFRRIEGKMPPDECVFLTDYHDLEMMLIASSAWQQILDLHASEQKLNDFQQNRPLKEVLFSLATAIACLRLLNGRENLGLRFKAKNSAQPLAYHRFVDKDSLTLKDQRELIKFFLDLSQQQALHIEELVVKIEAISMEKMDPHELCNGHDVIQLLHLALKKAVGSMQNVSPVDLESKFLLAYDSQDFQRTQLFAALKAWEKTSRLVILPQFDGA
jgi:hypothetical protein